MTIRFFLFFVVLFTLVPLSGAYKQGKILLDCRFAPNDFGGEDQL